MIEKVGTKRKCPDMSTLNGASVLHELVDAITNFLCTSPRLIVFPMFAGSGWDVDRYPAYYTTNNFSLNLLTMEQVVSVVGSSAKYAGLLDHPQICRDLLLLSGVPRWIVEYLTELKASCGQDENMITGDIGYDYKMLQHDPEKTR